MSRLTLYWHLRAIQEGVPTEAYSTGFPTDGRVCTAFTIHTGEAFGSGDIVAYLDAVANDPIRPFQERVDAAALLSHHIWPDAPRDTNPFSDVERDDVDVTEWIDAGFTRTGLDPSCFSMRCVNDGCQEGECLADPDVLRDEGRPVCMVCGTEQPLPDYP